MKRLLVKILIISGIAAVIAPICMAFLWQHYVSSQESLQANQGVNKQPCEPYQMKLTYNTENKLEISWLTKDACSGYLLLGSSYADFVTNPYKVMPLQEESTSTSHTILLQKQDELAYTYAVIVSNDQWYGLQGTPFSIKSSNN